VTVMCKGSPEARVSAATAMSNLVSQAESNKMRVGKMPEALQAVMSLMQGSTDKEPAVAVRVLQGLCSCR
jgi:hypothetical protein